MPIKIPSIQETVDGLKASLQAQGINPNNPVINAVYTSIAERNQAIFKTIQNYAIQSIPILATDQLWLENHALTYTNGKIARKQATTAEGTAIFTSNFGVDIPAGTTLNASNGLEYETSFFTSSQEQFIVITSLSRVNNKTTATLANHNLATGMTITISNATNASFIGTFIIKALDANTFEFDNIGTNATTTNANASFWGARVKITCKESGVNGNLHFTEILTLSEAINGLNDSVYLTIEGVGGGDDLESLEDFKNRILEYLRTPQIAGSRYAYQAFLTNETVADYAWVWAEPDTSNTMQGYFVLAKNSQAGETVGLSEAELNQAKVVFKANNQLVWETTNSNLNFINPVFREISISISGLTPNTEEMKTQIRLSIQDFLKTLPIKRFLQTGQLTEAKIRNAIYKAQDSGGNNPDFNNLQITGLNSLVNDEDRAVLLANGLTIS